MSKRIEHGNGTMKISKIIKILQKFIDEESDCEIQSIRVEKAKRPKIPSHTSIDTRQPPEIMCLVKEVEILVIK